MGKDPAGHSIKGVGFVNTDLEVARQVWQPVWASITACRRGKAFTTSKNLASATRSSTRRCQVYVNAKRGINEIDDHLYMFRIKKIKLDQRRNHLLGSNMVNPNAIPEPRLTKFSG